MTIWSGEIKELDKLFESFKGQLPGIMKELEQLIKTQDPNVVMLYSRRCLEVIITDLCEIELKRPRKTEPLKGIIDKLNSEEKVPSHIINSMLSLNSMASYGAHPKDFDPEQVKPVLNNLAIIIKWYLKYKDYQIVSKTEPAVQDIEIKTLGNSTKKSLSKNKRVILISIGILIGLSIVMVFLLILNGNYKNLSNDKGLEKTIAVLPFRNLSNDTTQIYFCDGFMEEMLNNLQRVNDFTVRSRTSTDQYRNTIKTAKIIGEEMNVNYLIEGSIGREANNMKAWIKLIEISKDKPIWSNDYTKEITITNIYALQSEIAKEIAGELKTVLSPEEIKQIDKKPTENFDAYRYYLLGNSYFFRSFAKNDFETAITMYEKALESDPDFALAYVRIAVCYMSLHWFHYEPGLDRLTISKSSIDKAFIKEPDLPDAHLALGLYYYWGFLNYSKALQEVEIALQKLNNSECYYTKAAIYLRAGDFELAKKYHLKSFELDPGIIKIPHNLAILFSLIREYTEAEKYFNNALFINPTFIESLWQKSFLYMKWDGNTIRARKTIDEAFQLDECKSSPLLFETDVNMEIYDGNFQKALAVLSAKDINLIKVQFYINLKSMLYAKTYSMMKKQEIAKKYYKSAIVTLDSMLLKDPYDSRLYSTIGIAYAGLGIKDKAIEAGRRGVDLMPIDKEAYRGVFRSEDLARIYVMVGENVKALELIDQLLKIPSRLSVKLLKLDPVWKPLWELPEFNRIISTYPSDN